MAVTPGGNHPSRPGRPTLSGPGPERRSSESTGERRRAPEEQLRASSEHTPSLLYATRFYLPTQVLFVIFGFTGYSQGGALDVFIILRRKKKPLRLWGSGEEMLQPGPCPSSLDTPEPSPKSAVQQLQGLEAPRDTQKG